VPRSARFWTEFKKGWPIADQQNRWIQAQLATGKYASDSELVRELIGERQVREQETAYEIAAIRAALIEGEKSGFAGRSVEEIWDEARRRRRAARG